MSLSRMPRSAGGGSKSAGGSGGGSGSGSSSSRSLESHPDFANSFIAEALINEAARKNGASQADIESSARLASENPDFWSFAEDGDDKDGPTNGRTQQKDELPGLRPKHSENEYKDFETGTPFVQGKGDENSVDPNDVKQGALGDCYLIAGMAAVARADPEAVKKCIKDNGDGTFDVTLWLRTSRYTAPRQVTRTIDAQLAVRSSGAPLYAGTGDVADGQSELWTALIEKTVAQHKESYDLISGGNINGDGFVYAGASEMLTGKYENYNSTDSMDEDDLLLTIIFALEDKQPIVASTRNIKDDEKLTKAANKFNVHWNHAYAPESVDLDARTVDLQNPWGSHHVVNLPIDQFKQYYKALRIGGGAA
jgi:hypothetical protein